MRISILFAIAWMICPALALAKPKVAVAPLDGDNDGKIEAVVIEAAEASAKVTSTKVVAKALKELSISDPDNSRAAKKLRKQLEVDAVIYGKVERADTKKRLRLSVYTRGKKPTRITIEYKRSTSKELHKKLRDELASRLAPDENGKEDTDDAKAVEEPTIAANDTPSDDNTETTTVHKHARHHETADTGRDVVTQAAAFADVGGGGVHRTLTYVANTGGTTPPRVGTGAFAVQFDGEIYPGAFDSLEGVTAALGAFVSFNKTAGLSIAIPGAPQSAPISETSYAIGVRYRFVFGQSSLAAGLSYWGQSFLADRSTLTTPTQLDTPDVEYRAVAAGALLRLAVAPTVGVTLQADLPLMLSSGPITDASYYGLASVIAFAVQAGADVALTSHYGLHIAGFFDQEGLSFKAGMLKSATDRTMGASAAFMVMY